MAHVEGRNPTDPTLMRPAPHLIQRAIRSLDVSAASCVFIGDQVTDMTAGRAAGVPTIGYANKPDKAEALTTTGADIVLRTMTMFTHASIDLTFRIP